MSGKMHRRTGLAAALAGATVLGLAIVPAHAEGLKFKLKKPCCDTETYEVIEPKAAAAAPATPAPSTAPAPAPAATALPEPTVSFDQYAALGGDTVAMAISNTGYIDMAIVRTQFRFRYDDGYGINVPDRAEYFYARCGGPGPLLGERNVDYQDALFYGEYAIGGIVSGFAELPVRFLNPEVNPNENGIGDVTAGFKAALWKQDNNWFTFQLKTFIPTGFAGGGLGTNHVSVEPAFLAYYRLTDRVAVEAELKDWISVNGTASSGNVLRGGVGASYDVVHTDRLRVTPLVEFVAWSVLDGLQFNANAAGSFESANGVTIVNVKPGIRMTVDDRHSFYVGYGRALTGSVWYEDIIRAEYRIQF